MPLDVSVSQTARIGLIHLQDWFTRPDTLLNIKTAVQETKIWLEENSHWINADGKEIREPWFDEAAFSGPLPNEMAEMERHYTLEIKAHEHGIGYLLKRLDALDVYDCDMSKALVFLRSGELTAWLRYLVRNSWKGASINLKEFRDVGDFGPGTPQAHAKPKLLQAAELGIALVDTSRGSKTYAISAGPVAKSFYEEAWYPVVKSLRGKISKWSEA